MTETSKKPLLKKPGKPEEPKVMVRKAPPLKKAAPKPEAEAPETPSVHKPGAKPAPPSPFPSSSRPRR